MSKRVKQYLMLFAALGVVAVALGGGSGTFASFNAQITNNGNYFATGTLFLHQQQYGSSNICRSEDGASNSNVYDCGALITAGAVKAGDPVYAKIALTNGGSITPSSFDLSASCTADRPTVAQAATYGTFTLNQTGTLTLSGMTQTLVAGTDLLVGSDTFQVTQDAVPVSGNATANVKATTATSGATGPVAVKLAVFGGDDFCNQDLQLEIQQTTDGTYSQTGATCVYPASNCTTAPGTFNDFGSSQSLTGLTPGSTKYYLVTLSVPSSATNALQNNEAKFDLGWTIAQ